MVGDNTIIAHVEAGVYQQNLFFLRARSPFCKNRNLKTQIFAYHLGLSLWTIPTVRPEATSFCKKDLGVLYRGALGQLQTGSR